MEMTRGPIVKTIMRLALPIMASSFLGTLYNMCDMAWVGTLGAKAVAGVGVGGMYMWFANCIATLPRMGGQVLSAQAIGAGENEKAKGYTRAALHLIVLLGILFGAVSMLCTRQMVGFFNLGDPVSEGIAISYMKIACGFVLFSFMNFTLAGLYTAEGDSKTPMIANFIGLVLNMILDPLMILGIGFFPRLETKGAAIATVTSQIIVLLILIFHMIQKSEKSIIFKDQNYFSLCDRESYQGVVRIGLPASFQSLVYCFISMLLTRLVAGFGPEAVAVARVGGQIESVSWNTADGFASAINSFCGQNLGASEYERIKKGYYFSAAAAFLWGLLVLIAFVFIPRPISGIFFHEEAVIALAVAYLFIVGFSEPFLMVEIVTIGALSGLGRTRICSILSVIVTGMRIPIAYILLRTPLGLNGIWFACLITTVVKSILLVITFVRGQDKLDQLKN